VQSVSESPAEVYQRVLSAFCGSGSEESLYQASLLSQEFIAAGIPPDEIVALHAEAVGKVVRTNDARGLVASQQLLLEVMIAYGVRYQEYAEMRLAEAGRAAAVESARAEMAERAERERLDLLASISHELGTPLTVVKGNVEAIRRYIEGNVRLAEALSTKAHDVQSAVDRMVSLREDLVAASRHEQRALDLVPVNAGRALARAVRWAQADAREKRVTLDVDDNAAAPYILGEEDALQSIFGNLLSNAVRYTPADGTVRVRCEERGNAVVLEVADTGIGLSEEAKSRLFERFYRAPEAKQVASFGLGLGLALTRDLVEALGGSIEAEGSPNNGATFRVTFPLIPIEET